MADEHLSKAEFLAHIDPIRKDISEIVQLQRDTNKETSQISARVLVLEDRSPGRVASAVSAVVSGVITGVGLWFSSSKQ